MVTHIRQFATLSLTTFFVSSFIYGKPEITTFTWNPKVKVQEFVVPKGSKGLFLRAWGAGGGSDSRFAAGAGGYVSGLVEVPEGSVLKIVVGKGGERSETGEASGVYLNTVSAENTLLLAAGGEGASGRKVGRGGGSGIEFPNFSDANFIKNRFFIKGEDGRFGKKTKASYDCTRTYKKGTALGGMNSHGGHGLVVISRGFQDFCFTGSDQLWTVPGGVVSITAHGWGAGGGGSSGYITSPGSGGGYATRTRTVEPGDKILVVVGGGGRRGFKGGNYVIYGGGGSGSQGGGGASYSGGGDGGGRTEISNLHVIAGGGGGAGAGEGGFSGVGGHPNTGVGGGATGGDGGDGFATDAGGGGAGGSQTAGGIGGKYLGDGSSYPGTDGSFLLGGNGDAGNVNPGGGGGGGLFGGGGGGGGGVTGIPEGHGGQGGGGSSFPSTGSLSGSGQSAGKESSTAKPWMAGRGGDHNGNGGDGFINITW